MLDVQLHKQPVLFWGGSAGADLTEQDKLFVETGGIYHRLAQLEKLGAPTISVVRMWPLLEAYIPGLCQVVIAIEGAEILFSRATFSTSSDRAASFWGSTRWR